MTSTTMLPFETMILDPKTGNIICDLSMGAPALPRFHIDSTERLAKTLCGHVKADLRVNSIVLDLDARAPQPYSIHEWLRPTDDLPYGYAVLPPSALQGNLAPRVLKSYEQLMAGGMEDRGRFARMGWLTDLAKYVDLGELKQIEQWSSGRDHNLLRFEGAGHSYWFKAVGVAGRQEYIHTIEMSQLFSSFLPEVVAQILDWYGWITTDIPGEMLSAATTHDTCIRIFEDLADLQQQSIPAVSHLLDIGMPHRSAYWLLEQLAPFFADVEEAMRAQTSQKSPALSPSELATLADACKRMLCHFNDLDLPEALVHGDIGHGNLIVTKRATVFLDWCEAYIGFPFLCAQHLAAQMESELGFSSALLQELMDHYCARWREYASPESLAWARRFSPPLGALAYILHAWARHAPTTRKTIWPYMRSITRQVRSLIEVAEGGHE